MHQSLVPWLSVLIMVVSTNNLLNIDVYLGADHLDQSNCIEYLGVKLDAHLTWNSQIDAVCKKTGLRYFLGSAD